MSPSLLQDNSSVVPLCGWAGVPSPRQLANGLGAMDQASNVVQVEAMDALLRRLAPFAPHLAEELWRQLDGAGSVHSQSWPQPDPEAPQQELRDVVIRTRAKPGHHGRARCRLPSGTGVPDLWQ